MVLLGHLTKWNKSGYRLLGRPSGRPFFVSGGSGRVGPAGQQVRWVRWAGRAGRVRRPDGSDTCELSCNIGFMICHGLCLAMSEVLRFERPPTTVTQEHKESHT